MTDQRLHAPVLLAEAISGLNVQEAGIYVDATFGRGGHSRAILARLGAAGRLLALDRDPEAVAAAAAIVDARFRIRHAPFGDLREVLADEGIARIDGLLLDLGVSSPQLDDAGRGFSFRADGPLDMRMDNSRGRTAAQWLNEADEHEIAEVIDGYGEERFAKRIARAIVAARAEQPFATTRQLGLLVAKTIGSREPGQDPATRTFQAVRIFVNQELEELERALEAAVRRLRVAGRLAVISFHSLEDRIVKQFIARESGRDAPRDPVRGTVLPGTRIRLRPVARVLPGEEEVAGNPRARSAVLRVAERVARVTADAAR